MTTFSLLKNSSPYIIAEVGQNHNGSFEEAKKYVSLFSSLGASAVKFQIRDNKSLFDQDFYNSDYSNENSYGATYGEHREFLELTHEEHFALRDLCHIHGVDYIVTPFDYPSLSLCEKLKCDSIKIASFDVGNLPFIDAIAKLRVPVIMSTGGSHIDPIKHSISTISKYHKDLAILHCVSHYPCPADKVALEKISDLRQEFPDFTVGISDHFNGILTGPLSYMLGARIFEKHVTLDRSQKGTDHPFSLEPDGFRRFVRDIQRTPVMISSANLCSLGGEPVFKKLGKRMIASRALQEGHNLSIDDIGFIITRNDGINIRDCYMYLGLQVARSIPKGAVFTPQDFR
jgi:sialic acid synthase